MVTSGNDISQAVSSSSGGGFLDNYHVKRSFCCWYL